MPLQNNRQAPALERGVVVGKYRVVRQLAQTHYCRVFAVEHHLTGAPGVLKVGTADAFERIRREASILASLETPYVPGLLQVGRLSEEHGRAACFVLETAPGPTLRDVLQRERRLDPVRALRMAVHLLSALASCHERGIVHGDIKPENLILSPDSGCSERAMLIDFGSATTPNSPGQDQLSVMATPDYAAPEVVDGAQPTVTSDLFSVASVLYEAVCGHAPVAATRRQTCSPPAELVPTNPALSSVVMQGLSALAEKRPASADEFLQALLAVDLEDTAGCVGLGGESHHVAQESVDTVEMATLTQAPPPEAMPSRPIEGDCALLLSTAVPTIWLFTGDPGIDQPGVREAMEQLSERFVVEELDADERAKKRIEYLSGSPPPWVIVFGDLHVLLGEPLLDEARRQGETSRLLISTHENWELLDTSVNCCGLHAHVCLPSTPDEIVAQITKMVERARERRRRYDTLRLALRDVQQDLSTLRQHAE